MEPFSFVFFWASIQRQEKASDDPIFLLPKGQSNGALFVQKLGNDAISVLECGGMAFVAVLILEETIVAHYIFPWLTMTEFISSSIVSDSIIGTSCVLFLAERG